MNGLCKVDNLIQAANADPLHFDPSSFVAEVGDALHSVQSAMDISVLVQPTTEVGNPLQQPISAQQTCFTGHDLPLVVNNY